MISATIVLAQINPTVGDLAGNAAEIRRIISSTDPSVDILIFPEGALPGYPLQDLVLDPAFITDLERALKALAEETGQMAIIVGTVRRGSGEEAGELYNTAALLQHGNIVTYRDKTLLPTYDVFSEARYFTPSDAVQTLPVQIAGGETIRLGLHICEDLWDDDYDQKICSLLSQQGIDLLINISASPYRDGILEERTGLIREKVKQAQVPYLYCNLVGGQDELIFDGRSMIFAADGRLVRQAKAFAPDSMSISLPDDLNERHKVALFSREIELARAIELGIKDYFRKTGHDSAYVGLSGGIDSALVATLAVNALGADAVQGIIMPTTFNSPQSAEDATVTAQNLNLVSTTISVESLRLEVENKLKPLFNGSAPGVAEENLQARLRGLLLMALGNKHGALVLTTGNKTEVALGYATLYGDMAGALAPIGDLSKTDVYAVARALNAEAQREIIPDQVLEKVPSAELRHNQSDPFDYDRVAPLVERLISRHEPMSALEADGYSADEVEQLRQMIRRSEHKRRQSAPSIRVTGKAFGTGRRYPIVNGYGKG